MAAQAQSLTGGELILTLSCPDRPGIVAAVAGLIAARGGNIVDSHQFGDPDASVFFMRIHFSVGPAADAADWRAAFAPLADELRMEWQLVDVADRPRVLVLVSREGHCLNDLLYRWRTGALAADVVGVASPYDDFDGLAATYGVPCHRIPGPGSSPAALDRAILDIVRADEVDLVVLARFMQILGPEACRALAGRAINIHHSFLPSFAGGRPYHQAHERGVKLIGATAHYVTDELDEGPIIEQEVARVDHAHGVAELARVGRDVECVALARAVRWHVEHRVLIHGRRTVVFR
jgi:formyltetrahydrofolate deformylase